MFIPNLNLNKFSKIFENCGWIWLVAGCPSILLKTFTKKGIKSMVVRYCLYLLVHFCDFRLPSALFPHEDWDMSGTCGHVVAAHFCQCVCVKSTCGSMLICYKSSVQNISQFFHFETNLQMSMRSNTQDLRDLASWSWIFTASSRSKTALPKRLAWNFEYLRGWKFRRCEKMKTYEHILGLSRGNYE